MVGAGASGGSGVRDHNLNGVGGTAPPSKTVQNSSRCRGFDDALPGARIEAAKLHELRTLGTIKFVQATSLAQLDEALHSATFDLLTVAVHGASGDGFEYRFLLPDGPSSPSALLRMPLPPTVVLGSCWSAASAVHQDTVAAALACLATGASRVIGGLWAIDDSVAGKLLARTYESHIAG